LKILFITHTRIGDAVMSSGILRHLIDTYPQARFTIVCGPMAASLFADVPNCDRAIVVTKRRFDAHWFTLWKQLRGMVWDIAVDLRRSLMTYVIPTRQRYIAGPVAPGLHHVQHLSDVLKLSTPVAPHLYIGAQHVAAARVKIPDGTPVLAIAPVAADPAKTWPADKFAALVHYLTAPGSPCAGWRVALFGGPGDAGRAGALTATLPSAIHIFNEPDLLTVAASLGRCAAFIGNDSGLSHMAAAVGIPALAVFGPTDPARYGPWGGQVVRAPGGDMASLDVETVAKAFKTYMNHV
jgi:ADP-heptose:LPS heptosyltransferase